MSERTVGQWVISTHIGSGSFAIVWKAKHKLTGHTAAIKEIALDRLNAKLRQSLESEVSILKRINHDNIVKLLEVFEEKNKLYLIMEYCAGGDLAHYIRAAKRVPEHAAQHFMQQLAAGLREMWAHHLVHRDLKPQNLLLEGPGPTARLKIADFGFARNLQPQGLAETLCGSPLYMAPEILHFHKYDAKADLWSVGAILFELVAGRPPFNGANQLQLLRNIERGEARLPDVVATQLSLPCRQLIHALLRRNPVERISFEEFFRHPFLTGPAPAGPSSSPFGPALPLGRSFSTNSIPQQVLGFKQGQGVEGGAGVNAAAAPLAGHAVVPPGQLSNQLKPRRSLDLDGTAQRVQQQLGDGRAGEPAQRIAGAAHAAAASGEPAGGAQLGAATPPQQAHQRQPWSAPQQGYDWGQQVARPQAAAAPQPAQGLHAGDQGMLAGLPTFGRGPAPLETRPLQPSPLPTTSPAALHPRPAAPPPAETTLKVPPPPRPPAAAPAASAEPPPRALPRATGAGDSADSLLDDDYVLVDTILSSRSQQQSPAPPASPASATGSLASSLHGQPADEVFTIGGPEEAAAGARGGASSPHPWLPAEEEEEEQGPRWLLLRQTAHAIEVLAASVPEPRQQQQSAQCLSLCLASLQVLEHALDSLACSAGAQQGAGAIMELQEGAAPPGEATASARKAISKLREDIGRVMERAQAAAAALARHAAAAGGRAGPESATLPDPWELCYHLSLGLAKEAAVEELLGNQDRSLQLYAKACCLLHFLGSEEAGLQLEPPLELTQQDRLRLQRYAAATSARWAACKAQLGVEAAA